MDPQVSAIWRVLPNARLGKGEALSAALDLARQCYVAGSANGVAVGVVDADGRLDPHAIIGARTSFADSEVGAVRMGVRIDNHKRSPLTRMQDMEFVTSIEAFQRGRRHLGSVGMEGNGQFVRLSALDALGPNPWSKSLIEDFDLGIRFSVSGWVNEFCREASAHQ